MDEVTSFFLNNRPTDDRLGHERIPLMVRF